MDIPPPSDSCQYGHGLPVKRRLRNALAVCPVCRYVCVLEFGHTIVPGSARVNMYPRWAWVVTRMQGGTIPVTNQLF